MPPSRPPPATSPLLHVQISQQFPEMKRRLLQTFQGYLEAEKADNPGVAEEKDWKEAYERVCKREKEAEKVKYMLRLLPWPAWKGEMESPQGRCLQHLPAACCGNTLKLPDPMVACLARFQQHSGSQALPCR